MLYANYEVPLIIINDYGHEHILGTMNHDWFYVDKESGGLQYHNVQCNEGTKKFETNSESSSSDTYFVEAECFEEGREITPYNNAIMVSMQTYRYMTQNFAGIYNEGILLKELKSYLESIEERWKTIEQDFIRMNEERDYSYLELVFSDDCKEELDYFLSQLKDCEEHCTDKKRLAMWLRSKGCRVLNDGQKWIIIM